MNGLYANRPPLIALRRDLASAARHITGVLEEVARGPVDVGDLSRRMELDEHDVHDCLLLLEARGLVRSVRFVVTAAGRAAAS